MSTAAVTMVWNDNWFLRRWIAYYGPLLGFRNLYVISHGPDDAVREIARDANVLELPRDPADIRFDKRRWGFMSEFTSGLTRYHDTVICLDVDELLVPTREGLTLSGAIEAMEGRAPRVVPGFELFPREADKDLIETADRLAPHMDGAIFSPFYSKSGIARRKVKFFPGAHGMIGEPPEYCGDLALMHLRFVNLSELQRRNAERMSISSDALTDRSSFLEEGKPFATWRKAGKLTYQAFKGYRAARETSWEEMMAAVGPELQRLRVRRGNTYKFLNKKYEPIRAPLPHWMGTLF